MKSLSSLCCKSIGGNICVCRNMGTSSFRNVSIIACPSVTCHLLGWKMKPSPNTASQAEALVSLKVHVSLSRTTQFSQFWHFGDSYPNVRLHTSRRSPQPTTAQTQSNPFLAWPYHSGISRPPSSAQGSLTNICPLGLILSSFLLHIQCRWFI